MDISNIHRLEFLYFHRYHFAVPPIALIEQVLLWNLLSSKMTPAFNHIKNTEDELPEIIKLLPFLIVLISLTHSSLFVRKGLELTYWLTKSKENIKSVQHFIVMSVTKFSSL